MGLRSRYRIREYKNLGGLYTVYIYLTERHLIRIIHHSGKYRVYPHLNKNKCWEALVESFLTNKHRVPDKNVPYVEAMLMGVPPFMVFRRMMEDVK